MTDNVIANTSDSGGATFATDEISSIHYPISKITIGAYDAVGTLLTGDAGASDTGTLRVTVATDDVVSTDWNGTAPPIGGGTEAAALRVTVASDSTGVLTVDGTVNAAQSGTWNITNISGTVSLPTGAATAANQTTANASLSNIDTDTTTIAGAITTDDAAYTAGSGTGVPVMGFFSTDTVDANDVGVLAMDASRRLLVSIEADNAGIGGGTQYSEGAATPATIVGTAGAMERDDALSSLTPTEGQWAAFRCTAEGALWTQDFNSDTISTNIATIAGAVSTQMQCDIVSAGSSTFTVGGVAADNAAVSGNPVLSAGRYDTSPATRGDGDVATLQLDSVGRLHVADGGGSLTVDNATFSVTGGGVESSALRVTLANDSTGLLSVDDNGGSLTVDEPPVTSGGLSMHHLTSAATNNATTVKASAGQVYSMQAMNKNASPRYLKFYNKASNPAPATDSSLLVKVIMIPGNSAGAGAVLNWDKGLEFTTGVAYAVVNGASDTDNTSIGSEDVQVNVDYK